MEKDLGYLELLETYGSLLTDTQRELAEAYYAFDLSLSEIAEERGRTRQSVSDALAKARKDLDGWEEKLGVLARRRRIRDLLARMRADPAARAFADELAEICGE